MIHKFIIINILLTIVLFYTGVHFWEQEKAFLDGLRALDRDSYNWASLFFSKMTFIFAVYACFVAVKIAAKKSFTGVFLGILAIGIVIYSLMMVSNAEQVTMEVVLPVIGIYIVGTMCLNVYTLLTIPILKIKKI